MTLKMLLLLSLVIFSVRLAVADDDSRWETIVTVTSPASTPIHLVVSEPDHDFTPTSAQSSDEELTETIQGDVRVSTYKMEFGEPGEFRFYIASADSQVVNPFSLHVEVQTKSYVEIPGTPPIVPFHTQSADVLIPGFAPDSKAHFASVFYLENDLPTSVECRHVPVIRKSALIEKIGSADAYGFHNSRVQETTKQKLLYHLVYISPELAFEMRDSLDEFKPSGSEDSELLDDTVAGFVELAQTTAQVGNTSESAPIQGDLDSIPIKQRPAAQLPEENSADAESDQIVKGMYDMGRTIEGVAEDWARFQLGLIPGVGEVLDLCEAASGKQFCMADGKDLSDTERVISGAGILLGNESLWGAVAAKSEGTLGKVAEGIESARKTMGDSGWALFETMATKLSGNESERESKREYVFKFLEENPDASESQVSEGIPGGE